MALYVTREGPVGTVNSYTNLTTYGGQTVNTVNSQGYNSIKEIWVMAIPNGGATDTTGCAFSVRLTGPAIKNGPATIAVGGFGSEITGNDAISKGAMAQVIPVDIGLNAGSDFWVQGAQNSAADIGTPEIAVTVCMTKDGSESKWYDMRYVSDAITVDTKYAVTGDGSGGTVNAIRVPGTARKLTKIIAGCGGLSIATAAGGINFLRLEGSGLVGGDVVVPINGMAMLSTTTGVTDTWGQAMVLPTDIDLNPGGSINVYVEHTGVAWSTAAETAVTLEMV